MMGPLSGHSLLKNTKIMYSKAIVCSLILIFLGSNNIHSQIKPSKQHPGYWQYNGQTTLLVGGWNHGHNPFLDHSTIDGGGYEDTSTQAEVIEALDELALAGGNLLRCVLDPGVGAGRQGFTFCARVGQKYDLNKMEGPYWERLQVFLQESQRRRIIIGLEIWDRFDWYEGGHQGWPNSPFNPKNNINYTTETSGLAHFYPGKGDKTENPFGLTTPQQTSYTTATEQQKKQYDLVRSYQEKFMDKLLSVTFQFDNVLYSANNEVRHQEPAWGKYWIEYIRRAAKKAEKEVYCTDMFWDLALLPKSAGFDHLLKHSDFYDYFDVSQLSAQFIGEATARERGDKHWQMLSYIIEKTQKLNKPLHMNKIYGSERHQGGVMGGADNAVEEFWRSLIAGIAGVRFHRPESGIGISERAKNCIKAVRLVEKETKFWEVNSRQDLISNHGQDEAYLAANPGEKYLLFLVDGGSVKLNLEPYPDRYFQVHWIDIDHGKSTKTDEIHGGNAITVDAPSDGHWVVAIVKKT